jgi:DUF2934 family protein
MPNTIHIAKAVKTRKPKVSKSTPTMEEIQLRAYHISLERNGAPGNPFDDWMQAESELIALAGKPARNAKVKSTTVAPKSRKTIATVDAAKARLAG